MPTGFQKWLFEEKTGLTLLVKYIECFFKVCQNLVLIWVLSTYIYWHKRVLFYFVWFFFSPRYSLLIRPPFLRFSYIRAGYSPFTITPDLFSILLAFHCGMGLYHLVHLCPLVPSISVLLMEGTIRSRGGGSKALSVLSSTSSMLQSLVVLVWLDSYVLYVSDYFS